MLKHPAAFRGHAPVLLLLLTLMLAAAIGEVPQKPASEPAAPAPAEVKPPATQPTLANVPYGMHAQQVLDFYQAASDKPAPVVFFIHGGGWMNGDKAGFKAAPYLAQGISVVAINYRFVPQAEAEGIQPPVKGPLDDAARALQFIRSKAAEWHLDKQRIGATGSSAGSCSSLWLAFHPDLANPKSDDPIARESTRLWCAAVVRAHAAHALLALKAGKHVHLEKAPATKLADMQTVVAEAREKQLLLQTGFMWRYNPGFNAIFDAIHGGWLGDVFLVRGFISNNLPAARRPEWAEYAGGSMFELGSHLVDAVVRLLGRPKTVTPFLRSHGRFDDSLKDNNVAVLEYERATAVLINTALQGAATPQRTFEVLGTNGSAVLQPIEPPTLKLDLVKAAGPYRQGSQQIPLPAYQRYEADFAELAAAVRGERPLSVSLSDELLIAETVLRVSAMP